MTHEEEQKGGKVSKENPRNRSFEGRYAERSS